MRWWLLPLSLLLAVPARAQIVPEREVDLVKARFDAGNYTAALQGANAAMALANFSDQQRIELHRIAALSAFNLGELPGADQHFLQLLQLNPDYVLDPFAAPPPALKRFEQVKSDNAERLNLVRQQMALRAEQERRDLAERERARLAEEERRRRVEELSRGVTVRTVEKHPLLINALPFGLGQFQQGRASVGTALAVTQGVLVITSLIGYFVHRSLYQQVTWTWTDRLTADGRFSIVTSAIPLDRQADAITWRWITNVSGAAFYAAWLGGAIDAFLHHVPERVSETREPAAPRAALQLTPEGAGLTLTVGF